jgi:SAM-dependent methyltransferase
MHGRRPNRPDPVNRAERRLSVGEHIEALSRSVTQYRAVQSGRAAAISSDLARPHIMYDRAVEGAGPLRPRGSGPAGAGPLRVHHRHRPRLSRSRMHRLSARGLPRRVFRAGSFDLVTSIASLDHMGAGAALRRMPGLLRPGGVLVVVGLARDSLPGGLCAAVPAVMGSRFHRVAAWKRHRTAGRPAATYQPPVTWPPPLIYRQTRRLAARVMPGARCRRHPVLAVLADRDQAD